MIDLPQISKPDESNNTIVVDNTGTINIIYADSMDSVDMDEAIYIIDAIDTYDESATNDPLIRS